MLWKLNIRNRSELISLLWDHFFYKNRNTHERTRHKDSGYHFIRELVETGLIKVEFIKSEEYVADLFTKSLNVKLFNKHKLKFVTES